MGRRFLLPFLTLAAPSVALACPPSLQASVVIASSDLPECASVHGIAGDHEGGDPFVRITNDCGEALELIEVVEAGETMDVQVEAPTEGLSVSVRTDGWVIGDETGSVVMEVAAAQVVSCEGSGCATAPAASSLGALLAIWVLALCGRVRSQGSTL